MRGSNPEDITTMPHNPVKSIKIDFHTADGVTPKPQPAAQGANPDAHATPKEVPAPKPQTELSPLEEALFPHWAQANGIGEDVHAHPENHYDFRGMFRQSGGLIHPPGSLLKVSQTFNKLQQSQPEPIRQFLDMLSKNGQ